MIVKTREKRLRTLEAAAKRSCIESVGSFSDRSEKWAAGNASLHAEFLHHHAPDSPTNLEYLSLPLTLSNSGGAGLVRFEARERCRPMSVFTAGSAADLLQPNCPSADRVNGVRSAHHFGILIPHPCSSENKRAELVSRLVVEMMGPTSFPHIRRIHRGDSPIRTPANSATILRQSDAVG
jgi:hypothetical protein